MGRTRWPPHRVLTGLGWFWTLHDAHTSSPHTLKRSSTRTQIWGGQSGLSPQNRNPLFSETTFSILDLNSKNETLDHCRHFPLSDIKIHSVVDEKTHHEDENIFGSGQIGTIFHSKSQGLSGALWRTSLMIHKDRPYWVHLCIKKLNVTTTS